MKKAIIATIAVLLAWCGVAWGDISSGLVGYWPLNQNFMQNASIVSDIGSGGNNGTLVNSPVVGADSVTFDGVDQYVDCGDIDLGTSDFTISVWVNTTAATWDEQIILGKYQDVTYRWYIRGQNVSPYGLQFYSPVGPINIKTNAVIRTNGWINLVVVVDRDTSGYIYYDGQSQTISQNDIATDNIDNTGDLTIGKVSTSYFTGQLSDVRIYNRALTPSEVTELYNLGRNSIGNATMGGVGF